MKKLSFLLGAAALLMTACSNDEVIEVTRPPAIGFDTFVDNSTRALPADDLSGTTLKDFAVWGVTWDPATSPHPSAQFFGTKVEKSDGAWSYQPLRYWTAGDSYRFSAIAPYIDRVEGACINVEQSTDDMPAFNDIKGGLIITFDNQKAAADIDLCYAWNKLEGVTKNQAPVQLVFSHMLSRVKFTFINQFPAMVQAIKITDLKITDATTKATINKVNGDERWTVADASTFEIPFTMQSKEGIPGAEQGYILGGPGSSGHNQLESDHHYIIPLNEEDKKYTVTFRVHLYNYDPTHVGSPMFSEVSKFDHTVKLPPITYTNNYSYNFVTTINQDNIDPSGSLSPIVFNPSVSGWADFTDNTVTLGGN